jgi:hypothetical protein
MPKLRPPPSKGFMMQARDLRLLSMRVYSLRRNSKLKSREKNLQLQNLWLKLKWMFNSRRRKWNYRLIKIIMRPTLQLPEKLNKKS